MKKGRQRTSLYYSHVTAALYLGVYALGVLSLLIWIAMHAHPFGVTFSAAEHRLIVAGAPQPAVAVGTRVAIAHPEGIAHHVHTAIITEHARESGSLQYTLGNGESVASRSVLGAVLVSVPFLGLLVSALTSVAGVLTLIGAPFVLFGATQFFVYRLSSGAHRRVAQQKPLRAQAPADELTSGRYALDSDEEPRYATTIAAPDFMPTPKQTNPTPYEAYGAVVKLARRTHRRIHPQVAL